MATAVKQIDAVRHFTVEYVHSWMPQPLCWELRLTGPCVGGYVDQRDSLGGKFADKEWAEACGRIFVETGVLPCHQTIERLGNNLNRMVAIQMAAYPAHWTEEERRESAGRYLFGARS
jgi:hypothetical protein